MKLNELWKSPFSTVALGLLLALSPIVFSMVLKSGEATLTLEGSALLSNHLADERPLPSIVFDPLSYDWGFYQARELSYLIDHADALFIKFCAQAGFPHFLSLSGLLCLLGIALAVQLFWRKLFDGLSDGAVTLGAITLFSTPFFFESGGFFRSSKMLCALALAVICPACLALFKRGRGIPTPRLKASSASLAAMIAGTTLFMTLVDRQGMVFALLLCMGAGLAAFAQAASVFLQKRTEALPVDEAKTLSHLCFGLLGATLFGTLYNRFLGPALIFHFNGYWPSFAFQQMDFSSALNFKGGLIFLLGGSGAVAGDFGDVGGLALGLFTTLGLLSPLLHQNGTPWRARFSSKEGTFAILCLLAYAFLMAGMLVSANLMTARHPPLLWPDVLRSVYFAPDAIIIVFFLMLALDSFAKTMKKDVTGSTLALAILAATALANAMALPQSIELMEKGHASAEIKMFSPLTMEVLRNPKCDAKGELLPFMYLDVVDELRGKPSTNRLPAPPRASPPPQS